MDQIVISEEQLEQLPREELIALVKLLLAEIERLNVRITELEARSSSGQPPATSRNSSQPPSRDQKTNTGEKKSPKRVGAKPGHQAATRPLVDNPDRVIEVKVEQCANCHADLHELPPDRVVRHQLAELPPVRPLVIETQIHELECPHCHSLQRGLPPEGLEPTRLFGPRLEATVIYYKQKQHLSYERIAETMRDLCGVELSEGGINAILRRGAAAAQPEAEKIAATVAQSEIIGSDETSARVCGRTWWQWVFRSAAGVVHKIAPTRGAEVIRQFMGSHCAECWVSDCYSSQLRAPAKNRQLCLAHQIRDLERVIEQAPQLRWPVQMQELFREAIHLWNRFTLEGEMTVTGYLRRVAELENRLDKLLAEDQTGTAAQNLSERYVKHRDHLLVFLHYPGVPPTNNACESALRPSVIHRKVTNGFRSEWAAKGYAALETVLETARLQGRRVFEVLVELMGKPVLPFLDTPNP
jgi:transposase